MAPATVTSPLVTVSPATWETRSGKPKGATPRVVARNQAASVPMTTLTSALPRGAPFATTLTRTVSPSTTVALAPATSEPFLTRVQAAPAVVTVPSVATNRQDR